MPGQRGIGGSPPRRRPAAAPAGGAGSPDGPPPPEGTDPGGSERQIAVGRRLFIGAAALGAAGIAFGSRVQHAVGTALGSGLGGLIPGGDGFRLYTITGGFPQIPAAAYRLAVTGLVDRPLLLTVADLRSMEPTTLVRDFQCVTGWRVPAVHWQGVRLSAVLEAAGVKPAASALTFESYDRADTESLTLAQARLPDVLVAYRMLGAPITAEHGGPVRLYVARMYGYKSLKWLSAVRVVDRVTPGFWEDNGYPVDAWVDGSMAAATRNIG